MPLNKIIISLFAVTLLFSSCSKQTVDSSSSKNFESSVKAITDGMSEKKKKVFKVALFTIFKSQSLKKNPTAIFHHKTADEIISLFNKLQATKAEQKRHRIKDLKHFINTYEKGSNQEQLKKFTVSNPSFTKESTHKGDMLKITLTISNQTNMKVFRIGFVGKVSSENGKKVWEKELFSYTMAQGIMPGERKTLTFYSQTSYKRWNTLPPSEIKTTFKVDVSMLQGKQKNILAADYKDSVSQEKLIQFKKELASLKG